jgi:Rha family phage regulatory protein
MFTKHIKGFKLEKLTYKTEIEGETTVVTDSLIVAKHFEIAHKTVLRTIRRIIKSKPIEKQSLFIETSYVDKQNRSQPKYLILEEGIALVKQYTGGAKLKKSDKLYIVKCGDFYKIGISHNVSKRIKGMQTGNPYLIELIDTYTIGHNVSNIEARLHVLFESDNIRGEWFYTPLDEIRKAVVGMIS